MVKKKCIVIEDSKKVFYIMIKGVGVEAKANMVQTNERQYIKLKLLNLAVKKTKKWCIMALYLQGSEKLNSDFGFRKSRTICLVVCRYEKVHVMPNNSIIDFNGAINKEALKKLCRISWPMGILS